MIGAATAGGADIDDTRQKFLTGNYDEVIQIAQEAVKSNEYSEEWRLLLGESLLTVGKYPEALNVVTNGLTRQLRSIRLRFLANEAYRANGRPEAGRALLEEINELASSRMWSFRDAANLVVLGKTALKLGADPRLVLDNFFDRLKVSDPKFRESHLASGELALDKQDYALAAKVYDEALKLFQNDPDVLLGVARAYAPTDRPRALKAIDQALKINPRHVPSFLLLADHLIDSEEYEGAQETLDNAFKVNPVHPEVWAYRAVIAQLQEKKDAAKTARETALRFWPTNPRVDSLIGRKLSQKYRFVEGAGHQRSALEMDRDYLPAKIQLAQDLLRLGEESEGWALASEVNGKDGYDVLAYNLITLHDQLEKFVVLTNDLFKVRMWPREAAIYGEAVLELLGRAHANLGKKYKLQPQAPTIVEIYPEQKDFAVRTFGMPGNPGYLGVCFGRLITANSPASQGGHPANWQAVLWHEFCHVITLQMTRNKMPRWLSEGISVYEERLAQPAWGEHMTPAYRDRITNGKLPEVGELSSLFLTARNDADVQFAYYLSSLVVEFLVQQYGHASLVRVLEDLGQGMEMNAALAKNTAPLKELEANFPKFARQQAELLGPNLEWDKPGEATAVLDKVDWLASKTKNYYLLMRQAERFMSEKKWEEAKKPLLTIITGAEPAGGVPEAYRLLSIVHRRLNETEAERQALVKIVALEGDALDSIQRLLELAQASGDWKEVARLADRYHAVNPLTPVSYRATAAASEHLGTPDKAIGAYRTLLHLDPADPARIHFQLATLLQPKQLPEAKRHVLMALEEAPRFRDAQKLLLELHKQPPPPASPPAEPLLPQPNAVPPANLPKQP